MNITGNSPEEEAFRHEADFPGALHAYSFLRQTAAGELGLRYGSLTEDDIKRTENPDFKRLLDARKEWALLGHKKRKKKEEERFQQLEKLIAELQYEPAEIVTWAGMSRDAAIVLWLCSQPDSVCRRARRKPIEYESQIDKWADENGLGMNGRNLGKAIAEFSRILNAVNESRGTPDITGGTPEEPDPNE